VLCIRCACSLVSLCSVFVFFAFSLLFFVVEFVFLRLLLIVFFVLEFFSVLLLLFFMFELCSVFFVFWFWIKVLLFNIFCYFIHCLGGCVFTCPLFLMLYYGLALCYLSWFLLCVLWFWWPCFIFVLHFVVCFDVCYLPVVLVSLGLDRWTCSPSLNVVRVLIFDVSSNVLGYWLCDLFFVLGSYFGVVSWHLRIC